MKWLLNRAARRLRRHVRGLPPKEQAQRIIELLGLDEDVLFRDPIQKAVELRDGRDRAYAWILGPDASDGELEEFSQRLASGFLEAYGREPRAAHIVSNELKDLIRLDDVDVRRYLRPWLNVRGGVRNARIGRNE